MKLFFTLFLILSFHQIICAQGGSPANFSVQGSMYANTPVIGRDDWFPRTAAAGKGVIDTAGVGGLIVNILANKSYTFTRRMAYPKYSLQNSRIYMDALYARDGNQGSTDITAILGNATKNCANPMTEWFGGAGNLGSSSNDFVDMLAHARRNGTTVNDSMWLYGGVSFVGAGGAHFYDYELYQSEITFINPPLWGQARFLNSGPDEGHTAWRFNSSGNITRAGDLIVAVSFDNAGVASIEIRLWVKETDYNTVLPTAFSWGGAFDKMSNGNQYGYGKINFPAGNFFYQVNSAPLPIPAAPWGTINTGATFSATMAQYKFFEFGVNLTGLGIDPGQILGSDPCASPFKKLMVKSRTGNSFTADLKDFVGPYDFLNIAPVDVNIGPDRQLCVGRDTILLNANPSVGSYGSFHWTSVYGDGIISNPDSVAIYVNTPGIYIVQSYVFPGCPASDADTIIVSNISSCSVLPQNNFLLEGENKKEGKFLKWSSPSAPELALLEPEYSPDGLKFATIASLNKHATSYTDRINKNGIAFYRLKTVETNGAQKYSNVIRLGSSSSPALTLYKIKGAPVLDIAATGLIYNGNVYIMDGTGKIVYRADLQTGISAQKIIVKKQLVQGAYFYRVVTNNGTVAGKLMWD